MNILSFSFSKQLFTTALFLLTLITGTSAQLKNTDDFKSICDGITESSWHYFQQYTIGDLWLLRNSIFARKGYNFSNDELRYFFEEMYPEVYSREISNNEITLSQEEKALVNLLKRKEEKKKIERQSVAVDSHTFQIKKNVFIKDEISIKTIEGAEYISISKLTYNTYVINIESKFFITAVQCCGVVGVTNEIIQQYLYYVDNNVLVEIPVKCSNQAFIQGVFNKNYIFFEQKILSGAPSLSIYDINSFRLIDKVYQLYEIEKRGTELEIWEYLDRDVEYPFKWIRKLIFRDGSLIRTTDEKKIDASGYFAG